MYQIHNARTEAMIATVPFRFLASVICYLWNEHYRSVRLTIDYMKV